MLATRKNIKKLESITQEKSKELEVVTELKGKLDAELKVARDIQQSMLPKVCSLQCISKKIELCASMCPAKDVGGDWYDFFMIGKNKLALIIADVSGTGIPAALYMVVAKTLIKSLASGGLSCKSICKRVNESLAENNTTNMFATAFIGILDLVSYELTYTNAGHNPPLLKRNGVTKWIDKRSGIVLGAFVGSKYISHSLKLKKNDLMLLYTDGFTEAINEKQEQYSKERLESVMLLARQSDSLETLKNNIHQDVAKFCGNTPFKDDKTLMLFKVL